MFFELCWTWHEDYVPYIFSHDKKTINEFKKDVNSLFKKYGKEYLKQETSWAGALGWVRFVADKLPELGYKKVEPVKYSIWGAYIIGGGFGEGLREDDIDFGKIVGKDLLQKALKHNKKMEKELDDRRKKWKKEHEGRKHK